MRYTFVVDIDFSSMLCVELVSSLSLFLGNYPSSTSISGLAVVEIVVEIVVVVVVAAAAAS